MLLTPVGIDIAKSVFQVHHVDESTESARRSSARASSNTSQIAALALLEWKRVAAHNTGRAN